MATCWRLRLRVRNEGMCTCGMKRNEKDHTLASQRIPWRTRIHNRARDCLSQQLRKMGATVDLERRAPQWTMMTQDEKGHSRSKLAQIDILVILGRDELDWLDVTIRRWTSSQLVHAAASTAGHAADKGGR